jgi:addiction module RelB/DinJ family antitoxin
MQTQEIKVLQTRVPAHLYNEVEPIFDDMGISVNDGIRMFITQVRNIRKMPFVAVSRPEIPNDETLAAIAEIEAGNLAKPLTLNEFDTYLKAL